MTQEAKELQLRAVAELEQLINSSKRELTFRAPTGSGKTYMMADFMNRVLGKRDDVIFLVSTLSKGGLAQQNHVEFTLRKRQGLFPSLNPFLINTEAGTEEALFIPVDHNVYVLPRDLYKKNGLLMRGAMANFLTQVTSNIFGAGLNKKIFLIKDECHQLTSNLDDISEQYFDKVINFSATPNLRRGQVPDVQITDDEAVRAKLIKRVELCDDFQVPVSAAIDKFLEIKKDYENLLTTHPCLIIQISNENKAVKEWERHIKPAIEAHPQLKWMLIVDKDADCDTNDDVKKLPVRRWKDYAKEKESTIDIIVFKMVISEGWDIPRACMLYQVRDTQSKQLDEQVMGRVRRNPRLLDFERLSPEAQELATTAWVWGVRPTSMRITRQVSLWDDGDYDITENLKVTTTRLSHLTEKRDFDLEHFLAARRANPVSDSIFELYSKFNRCPEEVQNMCYDYAHDDVQRWWTFMEAADGIKRAYNNFICDYDESMLPGKEVSFPATSEFEETNQKERLKSWVWCRKDLTGSSFSFDSEAERLWAQVLIGCENDMAIVGGESKRYLWGKNFLSSSEIKFEYYANGVRSSYPDFVMKDRFGRIHIFEVKSVNASNSQNVDTEEYKKKISHLKACYKHCSKMLDGHLFYLPTLKGDEWTIIKFENGQEDTISEDQFLKSIEAPQGV